MCIHIEAEILKHCAIRKVACGEKACPHEFSCMYAIPDADKILIALQIQREIASLTKQEDKKNFMIDHVKTCITGISPRRYIKASWSLGSNNSPWRLGGVCRDCFLLYYMLKKYILNIAWIWNQLQMIMLV
jgi:hypothetical protein